MKITTDAEAFRRVDDAVFALWSQVRRNGTPAAWGQSRRFQGRAAEFGLCSDYEVAIALAEVALQHHANNTADDLTGTKARTRAIRARIERAAGKPVGTDSLGTLSRNAVRSLIREAQRERIAWDALTFIAHEVIRRNMAWPPSLRTWFLASLRPKWRKLLARPKRKGPDPADLVTRDDALIFACRLAMESGAFDAVTAHRDVVRLDTRAIGAAELVAGLATHAGIGVGIASPSMEKLWTDRDSER